MSAGTFARRHAELIETRATRPDAVARATGSLPLIMADHRDLLERICVALPNVRGPVVGRGLVHPPGGDVAGAVDAAVALL